MERREVFVWKLLRVLKFIIFVSLWNLFCWKYFFFFFEKEPRRFVCNNFSVVAGRGHLYWKLIWRWFEFNWLFEKVQRQKNIQWLISMKTLRCGIYCNTYCFFTTKVTGLINLRRYRKLCTLILNGLYIK